MAATTSASNKAAVKNGVNVEALLAAREALSKAPQAAQFKWRATNEWKDGTHSHSTVEGYYGLGQEHLHKKSFSFDADHPAVFAAEDNGITPVEFVLVGLASCLTAGIAAVAQHRNIQLRSVKATIEGDMDIQGILGVDGDVRNGYNGIKVSYDIDADAKRDEIEALVAQSQKRSAVYDIVTNPTNVTVVVN
jgi:uncharacterized OsmC-like protein